MKIKGFDKNLCCRGMQYGIGEEYGTGAEHITPSDLCSAKVIHYCDSMQRVDGYYSCEKTIENRYCEIENLVEEVTNGEIFGSNHIRIVREITGDELDTIKGQINGNTGLFNSGYRNSGDWNSGNRNSGDLNSGDWNSGDLNSGDLNSGDLNSGDLNSGDRNSGDWNSGDLNSGDWNSGYRNSGYFNSCDGSNGVFCNQEDKDIRIFNIHSGMSLRQFIDSKYYHAMNSSAFILAEVDDKGVVKAHTFEEACAKWWENMSDKNRAIVKSIPNFDADVFEDITGIRI